MTDTILAICRKMLDDNEYSALPILADALEEDGFPDADLLAKFRGWETETDYRRRDYLVRRDVARIEGGERGRAADWLTQFAEDIDQGFAHLLDSADLYARDGETTHMGQNGGYKSRWSDFGKFWEMYEIFTGKSHNDRRDGSFFSCSC